MTDSEYPDDLHLAGLIHAATAAADEQNASPMTLGKRKRDDAIDKPDHTVDEAPVGDAPDPTTEFDTPQLPNLASVLFREPSVKSKKHSGPPLGKVFASLELAPENFLKLQTAAKAFMLDEAHPERRDVVGHKKNSGGSDLAKLNLWNCVDEFLSLHGYGEKYFAPGAGADIPGAPQRTMFWPQDSQYIIKLMMPLMRKMVTNERQRIYAAATRRLKENSEEQSPEAVAEESIMLDGRAPEADHPGEGMEVPPAVPEQQAVPTLPLTISQPTSTPKQSIEIYVNVVSDTGGALRRVIPRFSLTPEVAPNLASLLAEVEKRYLLPSRNGSTSALGDRPVVRVWLTDGLVNVVDDGEWMVALLTAGVNDWMDGIRVLVEV